jgi:hypothetical protein
MAAPGSPDLRGLDRQALLNDLAHGMTGPEAAAKYSRHEQSIKEFRLRNAGEISVIRAGINAELHQRLAAVPISDKALRIANYQQLRDDLMGQLEDSNLDVRARNTVTKTVAMLNRHVAEEMGDLRSHIDVTATKSLLTDFDIIDLDTETGQLSAVKPAPDSGD